MTIYLSIEDIAKNNISLSDILNILILIVQTFILILQLKLTQKINTQSISRDKGYLLIEKTNSGKNSPEEQFDLLANRGIGFYVVKSDIILQTYSYFVNGVKYYTSPPIDTFFTENNRFNEFFITLDLKESDKEKDYLDIDFIFKLINTVGYKYSETISVRFSKTETSSLWKMNKYNMSFNK